jgi:hypothetical protein
MTKMYITSIAMLVLISAPFAVLAAHYYLKESRPLNGGTYECVYDVGGREMISYQQWSCKPSIEM